MTYYSGEEHTSRKISDNEAHFQETHFHVGNTFSPGNTFLCILPTYVPIIMTNYFKLHYFDLFLRLPYCVISSFLYFSMISDLWQIHEDGAHSQSGLRFVVWNLTGSVLLCRTLSHQFCSLSSIFLDTIFINCI